MVKKTRNRSSKGSSKKVEEVLDVHEKGPSGVKSYFFFAIIGIVIITAVILMVTNAMNTGDIKESPGEQEVNMEQEKTQVTDMESLIKRVSELILVNPEEEPTVATVQDAEILRATNPSFYKEAKNGDRLLVWTDKAVLYSSEEDKLLSVMLISATSSDGVIPEENTEAEETEDVQEPESTVESEEAAIQVRNGTRVAGLAGKLSKQLKAEDFLVKLAADARLKSYEKTIIVKVSEKEMPATLKALTELLGAEVVEEAPSGETGVGDDIVVLIGSDYEDYLE